jgi:hypothetical protein
MASSRRSRFQALLLGTALFASPAAMRQERVIPDPGLSGYVLAPDGTPVSTGSVTIQSFSARSAMTTIDETGRFQVEPRAPGLHMLVVSVPGLSPYRVRVEVPRSRTVKLPPIHMSPATYFRVRFVSADGEPLVSPRVRRQSFDASGMIPALPGEGFPDRIDGDGAITIGPLPRGLTTFALDAPPLAQTRLPNYYATGERALVDGGTVIVQPGAVLQVDVVDENGAPVPQHPVSIEDVRPLSPLLFQPVRTSQAGRAAFERLSAGRYRVRTAAVERCGNELLAIAPEMSVPGRGTVRTRLVVGGRARFRFTSPLGPLRGLRVSALPEPDSAPMPVTLRTRSDPSPPLGRPFRDTSCSGGTDADGRVTLNNFPPGPARVAVRLFNSTYVRRVDVPIDGREIAIVVPDGFLPVRVMSADTHEPIVRAAITWTNDGGRVEAFTSATGEALLEGVGATAGTLVFAAAGFKSAEETLPEPPAVLHDVALMRAPPPITSLQIRVVDASGEPLPDVVVELSSPDPMEVARIAVTDAKGVVTFPDAPPGSVRLTATADGFVTAALAVAENHRAGLVMTMARESR